MAPSKQDPPPSHEERLSRWVRDHARSIRGFLWASIRNHESADELLQEVFYRAWQARDRYQESGQERAYLLMIADRLARDWTRTRARRTGRELDVDAGLWSRIEPDGREQPPEASLVQHEESGLLHANLELLSEPQRRVLSLRFFGDLPFQEIAAMTKTPLNTVLSHCRRGLTELRRLLEKEESK